jgi:hypothetical protein
MRWPSMGCIHCKMHAYQAAPVRGTHMRDVSMRWPLMRMAPCEKHVYERHVHEMADGRYTPMGEARI